jgi:hypothetical protein
MLAEHYRELWERMHELRETWLELRITVREDRPAGEATMLVDDLADGVDDALGGLEEALAAVTKALEAPDDIRAGARGLATAHERVTQIADAYWRALGSLERRRELHSLARRRGGEWAAWARGIEDVDARLPAGLTAVNAELGRAWTRLVERAQSGATSLTARSIGQQINVPGARCAEA